LGAALPLEPPSQRKEGLSCRERVAFGVVRPVHGQSEAGGYIAQTEGKSCGAGTEDRCGQPSGVDQTAAQPHSVAPESAIKELLALAMRRGR
jgi:hypothetical protein